MAFHNVDYREDNANSHEKPAVHTRIYHVAFYDFDQSLYICFDGCNFNCKGCVRRKSQWARYEVEGIKNEISSSRRIKNLNLLELDDILISVQPRKANLGGFEPTVDPSLKAIIHLLNKYGVYTVLLTNGHLLNREFARELIDAGLKEIMMSIKALRSEIFRFYTGRSNAHVLKNFKELFKLPVKLKAETVLIPGLVERDEIIRIAQFIASIDPSIPFRIDAYDAPDTVWKTATPEEILEAAESAKEFLRNVSSRHCESEKKGNAINLYP